MFTHKHIEVIRPFAKSDHDETGHYYITHDGKRYPSITTVLKLLDDGEWYPHWVASIARKEEITEAQAEIRCKEIGENSIEMGNIIHKLAEIYLGNKDIDQSEDGWDIENIQPMELFNKLSEHLDKHIDNIHGLEKELYSDELELAGTSDCIAEYDGVLSIIDFKNSRKPKTKSDCKKKNYFIQLCAYGKMWEFCTGQKIEQGVNIVVAWDGSVKAFKIKLADYEADLYKALVQIEQKKALNNIR